MDNAEETSKHVWKWTPWSSVCVGVGVLVFLLVLTADGPLILGLGLGLAITVIGGVAFGFVPRNPPKPGIHGPGSLPGREQRKNAQRKRP